LRHFAVQCFGPKRCQFFLTLLQLPSIVAAASQRCCYKFCSSTSSSIAFFTLKSCFLSVVKFAIFSFARFFVAVFLLLFLQCSCKRFLHVVYIYIYPYPYPPTAPSSHCLIFYLCILLYLLSYNNVINCAQFLLYYFKYPICIYLYAERGGGEINLCADKFN